MSVIYQSANPGKLRIQGEGPEKLYDRDDSDCLAGKVAVLTSSMKKCVENIKFTLLNYWTILGIAFLQKLCR